MSDLLFVVIIVVFFLLAGLFVRACDRIIGADEEATTPTATTPTEPEQVAA
ncbi:MAG: hypothetical protein QOF81_1730 [Acidimicrobiaceae bacterium]|nr:hypothetical protein [Acidimicrobiaceae bacterium]